MVINCYVKLGFKATPHIKNRPHVPDRIPYHPYAEYPVVWICEVDSSANCPLFQWRGERKIASQRVVNKMGTKRKTLSGMFRLISPLELLAKG